MTKKEIIEQTARELFWKHGFKKVSIDEICKKAQVSRKTFYTYYSNKNALVIAILDKLTTDMLAAYADLMNEEHKTFSEKMRELMVMKFEANKDFSMEFVSDFFHPDSVEILEFFNRITQQSIQLTKDFFVGAQQKGEMNPELDINFVMWYMQKQIEILQAPEIQTIFSDSRTMTKQISELLIYGIMPVQK